MNRTPHAECRRGTHVPHRPLHPRPRLHRRRGRPPALRLLRRAPRPLRLHRHPRTGPPRRPTRPDCAPTSWTWSANSASPRSATPAATSSPATTGRTRVGPVDERPRRLDLAWRSTETNRFGLSEYIAFLRKIGPQAEPMMAVNLGTRGVEEALELQEYANHPAGTALADLRHRPRRQGPLRHQPVVPGQRDGRPLADRPQDRRRSTGGSPPRRPARCARSTRPSNSSPAAPPASPCRPSPSGRRRSWRRRTTSSTTSPCTPTTRRATATVDSFLASAVDMESFIESVVATADHVGRAASSPRRRSTSPSTSGTSGTRSGTEIEDNRRAGLGRGAPPARGQLQRHRRRRLRLAAHRPAAARRPGHRRLPRPAGQRHRPDHDRAGRPGLAADHLLPLRPGRAVRARPGPRRTGGLADVRDGEVRRGGPAARHRRTRRGRHRHRLRRQPRAGRARCRSKSP